ncbi:MAG TPA: DinB family protein [Terriglobia bacterium]|nr:DinB family protein [Terriglobia bacterium]
MTHDKALRQHLLDLLSGGNAHLDFDSVFKNVPTRMRGERPKGAQHSLWEILEHLRIAQWDILEFSRDANHKSPEFPAGYWPGTSAPPDEAAWAKSIRAFRKDLDSLCKLVADESTDLYTRIPHGEGQTILREALVAADHNSYHLGEARLLRRLLGA